MNATHSIPEWAWDDPRMIVTVLDVVNAERKAMNDQIEAARR